MEERAVSHRKTVFRELTVQARAISMKNGGMAALDSESA